jgi:hypothetical protein
MPHNTRLAPSQASPPTTFLRLGCFFERSLGVVNHQSAPFMEWMDFGRFKRRFLCDCGDWLFALEVQPNDGRLLLSSEKQVTLNYSMDFPLAREASHDHFAYYRPA